MAAALMGFIISKISCIAKVRSLLGIKNNYIMINIEMWRTGLCKSVLCVCVCDGTIRFRGEGASLWLAHLQI